MKNVKCKMSTFAKASADEMVGNRTLQQNQTTFTLAVFHFTFFLLHSAEALA